jgi:hypothetical protein
LNSEALKGREKMSNLYKWDVEDEHFWETEGKKIATRNLWISSPCLLCGFAVWLYWSIITVQMLNLGFPFSQSELFTLSAIAGLSGATLRIPSSFLIRIAGGRNTIFFTTALLMLPAVGTGIALQDMSTPIWAYGISPAKLSACPSTGCLADRFGTRWRSISITRPTSTRPPTPAKWSEKLEYARSRPQSTA